MRLFHTRRAAKYSCSDCLAVVALSDAKSASDQFSSPDGGTLYATLSRELDLSGKSGLGIAVFRRSRLGMLQALPGPYGCVLSFPSRRRSRAPALNRVKRDSLGAIAAGSGNLYAGGPPIVTFVAR